MTQTMTERKKHLALNIRSKINEGLVRERQFLGQTAVMSNVDAQGLAAYIKIFSLGLLLWSHSLSVYIAFPSYKAIAQLTCLASLERF